MLHEEVLVEYVRRMMKRKIKLKHKQQQEEAAAALCDDGQKIHTLFTDAVSTHTHTHTHSTVLCFDGRGRGGNMSGKDRE